MGKDLELDAVGRHVESYPCGLTWDVVPKQSILKVRQVPALILPISSVHGQNRLSRVDETGRPLPTGEQQRRCKTIKSTFPGI